jgi:hypothetical protein
VGGHRGKKIRVHVERDADRHCRRDLADPREQLAFAVVKPFGNHRPVQIEEDRVGALQRPRRRFCPSWFRTLQLPPAARRRIARDRQHHLGARAVGKIEEPRRSPFRCP